MPKATGPTPLQAALAHLGTLKVGTDEYAAAYSTVKRLREERPTSSTSDFAKTVPCGFGTCSRLFATEVGANDHGSGRKRLDNGEPNPDFCQGAADYSAAKAMAGRAAKGGW